MLILRGSRMSPHVGHWRRRAAVWGCACTVLVCSAATLCATAAAGAAPSTALTPAQQTAVATVQQQAALMPAAETPAVAQQQQEALQPAVDAAVAQGSATVKQLLDTSAQTNPSVAADLLKADSTQAVVSAGVGATAASVVHRGRQPVAHAAGCYGDEWEQNEAEIAGAVIGWVYINANSWCGNPNTHTITTPLSGEFNHNTWAWGPYCNTDIQEDDGWDQYPSEMHSITAASLGVSYVFGCFGESGYNAAIEIWASGVVGWVDDWGF